MTFEKIKFYTIVNSSNFDTSTDKDNLLRYETFFKTLIVLVVYKCYVFEEKH